MSKNKQKVIANRKRKTNKKRIKKAVNLHNNIVQLPKQPTISACMMVKNEEKNIDRCLKSVKGNVDEIIIIDTGSTDNTVKVCESYGAKVFNYPFEGEIIDDFSKYRNLSIQHASSDWLMIIDADEELFMKTNSHGFRKSLANIPSQIHGLAILFEDVQKDQTMLKFNSSRIFRKGKIHYEGIVHNQPIVEGVKTLVVDDIFIRHYGYDLTPEQSKRKRQRTESLLKKRIEINPDDHLAYFYLAQHYALYNENEKAIEYGEKYIEQKDQAEQNNQFMFDIYYCIFHCYVAMENAEKANEWLNMGLKALPNDLDMAMALTEYGVWQRRADLTILGSKRFIELYEQYEKDPTLKGSKFIFTQVPEALGFCHFHYLLIQLHDLKRVFNEIKNNLPKTNPKFKNGLTNDLTSLFNRMGFPEMKQYVIPESIIKTVQSIEDIGLKIIRK